MRFPLLSAVACLPVAANAFALLQMSSNYLDSLGGNPNNRAPWASPPPSPPPQYGAQDVWIDTSYTTVDDREEAMTFPTSPKQPFQPASSPQSQGVSDFESFLRSQSNSNGATAPPPPPPPPRQQQATYQQAPPPQYQQQHYQPPPEPQWVPAQHQYYSTSSINGVSNVRQSAAHVSTSYAADSMGKAGISSYPQSGEYNRGASELRGEKKPPPPQLQQPPPPPPPQRDPALFPLQGKPRPPFMGVQPTDIFTQNAAQASQKKMFDQFMTKGGGQGTAGGVTPDFPLMGKSHRTRTGSQPNDVFKVYAEEA